MTVDQLLDRLLKLPREAQVYVYTPRNDELGTDSYFIVTGVAQVNNFIEMSAGKDEVILYI